MRIGEVVILIVAVRHSVVIHIISLSSLSIYGFVIYKYK